MNAMLLQYEKMMTPQEKMIQAKLRFYEAKHNGMLFFISRTISHRI